MTAATRREVLRAILGSAIAGLVEGGGAGCASGRRVPDGELLDFGRARAHDEVRDRAPPLADASWPRLRVDVAIVGGGVAGLSAAWRLRQAGVLDLALFEADERIGGTAQSGRNAVTAFPWGAHYVVLPGREYPAFTRLLGELGAIDGLDDAGNPRAAEQHACREPEERHFFQGQVQDGLYPLAGETAEEAAQRERFQAALGRLSQRVGVNGGRAFTLPSLHCADPELQGELDQITMGRWLSEQGFTSWRLRWLCDYACRDDYGCTVDEASAWAGLFYFCARKGERGEDRPVITWPEGNGRIVQHLREPLGERVRAGHVVVDIDQAPDGVELTAIGPAGPLRVSAAAVVVATPRFVARHVVRALRQAPPPWLSSFQTTPWVVVNLHLRERPGLRGRPLERALAWDTVFVESRSLGYVNATHQTGRDQGATVLTWYRPLVDEEPASARASLLELGREHWAAAALAELSLLHPDIHQVVERVDVGRFGHAMVRPVPGLFSSGALAQAQAPIGSIHFAHTDLSGMALCEEAFFHGVRAAEEILAARGHAVPSLLARVR